MTAEMSPCELLHQYVVALEQSAQGLPALRLVEPTEETEPQNGEPSVWDELSSARRLLRDAIRGDRERPVFSLVKNGDA